MFRNPSGARFYSSSIADPFHAVLSVLSVASGNLAWFLDRSRSIWYYVAKFCNYSRKEIGMGGILTKISLIAVLLTAATSFAGAGEQAAPLSTPELKQIIGSGSKNTIVFFLNPSGGPCRAQNEILQKLAKDRKSNFNIAYVSATQGENQRAFYDYGVRSLPTLVLVNSKGKIGRMFPPGIQSYEAVAAALDGMK